MAEKKEQTEKEDDVSLYDAYAADKKLGSRMGLAEKRFKLCCPDTVVSEEAKVVIREEMMAAIKEDHMAPLYEVLCKQFGASGGWPLNTTLLAELRKHNTAEMKRLDDAIADAVENEGDIQVRDAVLAKADYASRIWDTKGFSKSGKQCLEKSMSVGQKIDSHLYVLRNCLMHVDLPLAKKHLEKAQVLVENGGDWDRRNRLRVYQAVYLMAMRRMDEAAQLFLEAQKTFTSYDLLPYETFIFYTIVTSLLALNRPDMREKVINSPEVLSVVQTDTVLTAFMTSLHECKYQAFFQAVCDVEPLLRQDRFLSRHVVYIVREMRVKAYGQLLQSYRSVTLSSMATQFGVSKEFLDQELSRFIASKRLNAKIDKVGSIVETNQPDAKNTQYLDIIKQGDVLLNQVGKLARAIH